MARISKLYLIITLALGLSVFQANAAQSGGHALGFNLSLINASQNDMNELIKRSNTSAGGISTSELNQAYEAQAFYMYRFSGTMFALQFRPSYFYQVQDGSGSGQSYDYELTGFTIFPIFRLYPLESDIMKFYMQAGLGYGRINGKIKEADASVEFAGGGFGSIVGLGSEFCFTPNHCLMVEGNYRYLTIERLRATGASGSFRSDSLSQAQKGQEVELDNNDVSVRMGGLMFVAGYTAWF